MGEAMLAQEYTIGDERINPIGSTYGSLMDTEPSSKMESSTLGMEKYTILLWFRVSIA